MLGRVTGFEFLLTLSHFKRIRHLRMQISEYRGKISANLQPRRNQENPGPGKVY